MMSELVITQTHDEAGGEFAIEDPANKGGPPLAELTYRRQAEDGRIVIVHTLVDQQLEGRGVGKRLVTAAVTWARQQGLKVAARCSFARAVLDKTPAFADVRVAAGV